MLVIRQAQFEAFESEDIRLFVEQVLAHIRCFFPRTTGPLEDHACRELIQNGIARARGYGVTRKNNLCKYVDVMVVLGENFEDDPEYAWARSILGGPDAEERKVARLLDGIVRRYPASRVAT